MKYGYGLAYAFLISAFSCNSMELERWEEVRQEVEKRDRWQKLVHFTAARFPKLDKETQEKLQSKLQVLTANGKAYKKALQEQRNWKFAHYVGLPVSGLLVAGANYIDPAIGWQAFRTFAVAWGIVGIIDLAKACDAFEHRSKDDEKSFYNKAKQEFDTLAEEANIKMGGGHGLSDLIYACSNNKK